MNPASEAKHHLSRSTRSGFTLIELLVVIAVIALLVAIIMPAVQNSRAAARRTQCKNNLKQLGLGLQNHASLFGEKLPRVGIPRGKTAELKSWAITLLPFIEQNNVFEAIETDPNYPLEDVIIPPYACPDDASARSKPGQLTYVVNLGYLGRSRIGSPPGPRGFFEKHTDYDQNIQTVRLFYTNDHTTKNADGGYESGVFWPDRDLWMHRISGADGTTNTIAMSENIYAGSFATDVMYDSAAELCSPGVAEVAFGIGDDGIQLEGEADAGNDPTFPDSLRIISVNFEHYDINGAVRHEKGSIDGAIAAPNSNHTGGVHMLWVDGHVDFMSEDVDDNVYARALTWGGLRKGEQLSGGATQNDDNGSGGGAPNNPTGPNNPRDPR